MIEIRVHSPPTGWHLRPSGDSLPVCTWRGEGPIVRELYRAKHRYPEKGCQGEPLPERKGCERRITSLGCKPGLLSAHCCACEETP